MTLPQILWCQNLCSKLIKTTINWFLHFITLFDDKKVACIIFFSKKPILIEKYFSADPWYDQLFVIRQVIVFIQFISAISSAYH